MSGFSQQHLGLGSQWWSQKEEIGGGEDYLVEREPRKFFPFRIANKQTMWEYCGASCAWLNEREGKVNIGKLYLLILILTDYVEKVP